jgi:ubiquinone/menaquinone biosynthesis C-methylase UbiE
MPPGPETISKHLDAVYPAFALLAGMELDLWTPLKEGPHTAEQLAAALDVRFEKLRPLLYALVATGLLSVDEGLFSNTAETDRYLVRGESHFMGDLYGLNKSNWHLALRTADIVRSGKPPEGIDYHDASPEELLSLFRGFYPGVRRDAKRLLERYDFSDCDSLLDVGGGSGALAITIAQANPGLRATVLDLPSVIPITRQFIEDANAADQVAVLAGDAVHGPLSGSYNVIVARHVIQVLSAGDGRAFLRNLIHVLEPGGVLYIIGWVLDNSRISPSNIAASNLVLLSAYDDGQAYTEQEYRSWLAEAGFEDIERWIMTDGASIITASKPI